MKIVTGGVAFDTGRANGSAADACLATEVLDVGSAKRRGPRAGLNVMVNTARPHQDQCRRHGKCRYLSRPDARKAAPLVLPGRRLRARPAVTSGTWPCGIGTSGEAAMKGSTSANTPSVPTGVARTTGGGTGNAYVSVLTARGEWPLRDFIELGALPGAVPCARLHTRQLMWEWRLTRLSENAELLVSELVTNAVQAARGMVRSTPVRLWLLADKTQLLILVWDASPREPACVKISEDTEGGRGLLLVEAISVSWDWYFSQDAGGKVVWAVIR